MSEYSKLIQKFAKNILFRMLSAGESKLLETEQLWLSEYADILYIMFPNESHHVQKLANELNKLKYDGVSLRINTFGLVDETTEDMYIIGE